MRLFGHAELGERRRFFWGGIVIHVAVTCLVATLASRVFQSSISQITAAQCNSPKAKIQHLAKDAFSWAVPIAAFLPELSPIPVPTILAQDDPLLPLHVDSSLYDRPPPIS